MLSPSGERLSSSNGDGNNDHTNIRFPGARTAFAAGRNSLMFRIWREPEVVVRDGVHCIVQSASDSFGGSFDHRMLLDLPFDEHLWLVRPQMNGYNVHDGVHEETLLAD